MQPACVKLRMARCATLFDNPLESSEAGPRLPAGRAPLRFSILWPLSTQRRPHDGQLARAGEVARDGSRAQRAWKWRYAEEENAGTKPIEKPQLSLYHETVCAHYS